MGSGKSTVGPIVARALRYSSVDLDEQIEEATERSVSQIFKVHGEETFRELERVALRSTAELDWVVVSTGGGTFVDERNRQWAREHGTIVYLKVDPATLVERLAPSASRRPLLWSSNGHPLRGKQLLERIKNLLDERSEAYEGADYIVDAGSGAETVADRVRAALREH